MSRTLVSAVAVLTAVTALTTMGQEAAADTPPPTPTGEVAEKTKQVVDPRPDDPAPSPAEDVADRIARIAQFKDNGFARIRMAGKENRVELWWHGQVDRNVQEIVDETNKEGKVTVEVRKAVHSRAYMRQLSTRLPNNPELANRGIEINEATAPPDQSGFHIKINPLKEQLSAEERSERMAFVKQEAGDTVGVPILSVQEAPAAESLSRQNDHAPWWGGGMMVNVPGYNCSTGFTVDDDGDGSDMVFSAAHCNVPYDYLRTWTTEPGPRCTPTRPSADKNWPKMRTPTCSSPGTLC